MILLDWNTQQKRFPTVLDCILLMVVLWIWISAVRILQSQVFICNISFTFYMGVLHEKKSTLFNSYYENLGPPSVTDVSRNQPFWCRFILPHFSSIFWTLTLKTPDLFSVKDLELTKRNFHQGSDLNCFKNVFFFLKFEGFLRVFLRAYWYLC